MAKPTKTGIPASAVFIYDDNTDKYVAWDGAISLSSDGVATESTLKAVAGFVILPHDYMEFTYVAGGFGIGEVATATYKTGGSAGTTVAILTFTYDSNNRIATITKS